MAVRRAIERERVPLVRQARLFEYLLLVFRARRRIVRSSGAHSLSSRRTPGWAAQLRERDRFNDHRHWRAGKIRRLRPSGRGRPVDRGDEGDGGRRHHRRIWDQWTYIGSTAFDRQSPGGGRRPRPRQTNFGGIRNGRPDCEGQDCPGISRAVVRRSECSPTDASLKGKVYLIDFWATWCAPCIAEFPSLTKLYEQYRRRGFEVLSYSVDANREVVSTFRKDRFRMPWLHAIDPELREQQSPMAKDFEVLSLPRPLLVDATGTIVAVDDEC